MGDFGDALGGGASGALTGFSMGGPVGAAIGGGIGLLTGLFAKKQDPMQTLSNPYQGQIDSGINQMLSSKVGAQMASNRASDIKRTARDQYDSMQRQGFGGNASVMSALLTKTQRAADDGITNANVQGADLDMKNKQQGLSMEMQNSQHKFQMDQYNNQINAQNNKPGFFQNQLMSVLTNGAASGLNSLLGGGGAGGGDGSPTGNAGSDGAKLTTPGYSPTLNIGQAPQGGYTPPQVQGMNPLGAFNGQSGAMGGYGASGWTPAYGDGTLQSMFSL